MTIDGEHNPAAGVASRRRESEPHAGSGSGQGSPDVVKAIAEMQKEIVTTLKGLVGE